MDQLTVPSVTVIAITNKPTQSDPRAALPVGGAAGADAEEELKVLQAKLDSLKQPPKKKFNYPQTAA